MRVGMVEEEGRESNDKVDGRWVRSFCIAIDTLSLI